MTSGEFELILEHQDCVRRIILSRGQTVVIGRSANAGFFLAHGSVSRRHAQIIGHQHGVELQDLASRNGVYLNGQRFDRFFLGHNSLIQIGRVAFLVRLKYLGATPRCSHCRCDMVNWQPRPRAVEMRLLCSVCEDREYNHQIEKMDQFLQSEGLVPKKILSRCPYVAIVRHSQLRDQNFRVRVIPLPVHGSEHEFQRFRQQARVIAGFEHPGLIKLVDVRSAHEFLYLVTEANDGPSLQNAVQQQGPLPLAKALAICRTIIETLKILARERIYHHNLNPETVVLQDGERPKLVDVRLGPLMNVMGSFFRLDDSQTRFLAPELFCEAIGADERADIFSLANLLIYMATGRDAFHRHNSLDIGRAALLRMPLEPDCKGLPKALWHCLQCALSFDPLQRPATLASFQKLLDEAAVIALVPQANEPPTHVMRRQMPFRGVFTCYQLPELLLLIARQKLTGTLTLNSADSAFGGEIRFADGLVNGIQWQSKSEDEAFQEILAQLRGFYIFQPNFAMKPLSGARLVDQLLESYGTNNP